MKRISLLFAAIVSLTLYSCGVYSFSSGMADESAVCFVAEKSFDITVCIDGNNTETKTVKQKPYKARRNIKKTAKRQIAIAPGRHKVKVTKDGQEVYSKEIYVSANEVKIIEL